MAREHSAIFMETSSKEGHNILDSLVLLAREMCSSEDVEVQSSTLLIRSDSPLFGLLWTPEMEPQCVHFGTRTQQSFGPFRWVQKGPLSRRLKYWNLDQEFFQRRQVQRKLLQFLPTRQHEMNHGTQLLVGENISHFYLVYRVYTEFVEYQMKGIYETQKYCESLKYLQLIKRELLFLKCL